MKILNEIYTDKQFEYGIFDFYFKDLNYAVFDIETTGLSPKKSQLILSGFVIPQDDGTFLSKQIFAESLSEEDIVIEETLKILDSVDFIITYNGISFDIPFIAKRMSYHYIKRKYLPYNLDLYKVIRNHSDIGKFTPNLKQKTIENYMGLWTDRTDEIDGAESVKLYFEYLTSRDEDTAQKIMLHNSDDVKQLRRLLNVLKQTDLHHAMCSFGFPLKKYTIDNIKLTTKKLFIKGSSPFAPIFYQCYNDEAFYRADFNGDKFQIEVSLLFTQGLSFIDLDFYNASYETFSNCGGLNGHYLVLAQDKIPNYTAIATFIKYLIERILENEIRTDC